MSGNSPSDRSVLRNTAVRLGIILLIGLTVRLVYLWQASEYPNFLVPYAGMDAALYHNLSKQIADGDILLGKEAYYYSPFYAYFLGGLYSLFGGSLWVARLANVLLGTGSIALIYLFTFRLFQSTTIALLTGLGASIYGPFIVFDTSGLKTSTGIFFMALLLLLISHANDRKKTVIWLFAGTVAGFALSINGQVGIFLLSVCLLIPAVKTLSPARHGISTVHEPASKRLLRTSLFILGLSVALVPFAARNCLVANDPVLVNSNSGIHYYIGNHEKAWGGYSQVSGIRPNPAGHFYDARLLAEKETGKSLSASEVSAYWRKKAFDFIKTSPWKFISLIWGKTLLFFSDYEIPNNENYQYLTQRSSFLSLFPGIGILLPLGLSGILLSFTEYRRFFLLYMFFFSYAAAVILTFVTWRYRLPVTLALLPFAGYFLASTAGYIKNRQFKSLIICAFLLLACWGVTQASKVKEQRYNADIKSAEAKMKMSERETVILRHLDSASDDKNKSRLLFELAGVRRRQFDIESSIEILREALALDPYQPRQWRALSSMLRRLGHADEAKKAKESAREYRPRRSP